MQQQNTLPLGWGGWVTSCDDDDVVDDDDDDDFDFIVGFFVKDNVYGILLLLLWGDVF